MNYIHRYDDNRGSGKCRYRKQYNNIIRKHDQDDDSTGPVLFGRASSHGLSGSGGVRWRNAETVTDYTGTRTHNPIYYYYYYTCRIVVYT